MYLNVICKCSVMITNIIFIIIKQNKYLKKNIVFIFNINIEYKQYMNDYIHQNYKHYMSHLLNRYRAH
jgi:hypothetical protein